MATTVEIRQNDLLPLLDYTLVKDTSDTAHDLTDATVRFTMRNKLRGNVKINRATMTIIDAAAGQVRYSWIASDTNVAGEFVGEIEVTFSSGKILTFPEEEYIPIIIKKELG
jgi:hypothetical protein